MNFTLYIFVSVHRNQTQAGVKIKNPNRITFVRHYSTSTKKSELTHVNKDGKMQMVDVNPKENTIRTASARAVVKVGPIIGKLIHENSIKKGDVLTVAEVAGILGAKKTSELIPLCHNIPLSSIKVSVWLNEKSEVIVQALIQCTGKTGVEMEALVAVSIAALTVYDMCKAVSKDIIIGDIQLVSKCGGQSGDYVKEEFVLKDFDSKPTWGRFSPFVGPV